MDRPSVVGAHETAEKDVVEVDVPIVGVVGRRVELDVLVGECRAEEDVLAVPDYVAALGDAEVLMPRVVLW